MNQVKWVYYAKITFENFCTSFGIFVPDVTHTVLQSLWLSSSTAFMQKNVFTSLIILQTIYASIRVANVVADHDDLLTQWRPIKMSKFCANIFLIQTTSNYFWASEVSKNQVFKSQFFSSSHASNQWIMKIW